MEKCWSEDPDKRPEFSQLAEEVEKVVMNHRKEHPEYVNMTNGCTTHNGHAVQLK